MRRFWFLGTLAVAMCLSGRVSADPAIKAEIVGSVVQIVANNNSASAYKCSLAYTIYWGTYGEPKNEKYTKSVTVPPNSKGAVVTHTGSWSGSTLQVSDVRSECSAVPPSTSVSAPPDPKCPAGLVHLGDVKYENYDGKSGFAIRSLKIPEGFYIDTTSPIAFSAATGGGGAVSRWDGKSAPNGLWVRTWGEKYWSAGNDVAHMVGLPSINPSVNRAQDSVSIGLYCGAEGKGFVTMGTYCNAQARFCAKPGNASDAKHQYWDTSTSRRVNVIKDFPEFVPFVGQLTPLPGSLGESASGGKPK